MEMVGEENLDLRLATSWSYCTARRRRRKRFSRHLVTVGLLAYREGTVGICNCRCPPFCPQIPRIVRFHLLPTFPVQSLIRLLWNHAVGFVIQP